MSDSLYKRWGFDSASNAISLPASASYFCGLKVKRDEIEENYDSVIIKAEPSGIISYIYPDHIIKSMNILNILPLGDPGQCSLNVYGGNADLIGMDDYWGVRPIHFINAYSYSPIVYSSSTTQKAPLEYYLLFDNPKNDFTPEELKNKMNEIIHQAVVHINNVTKILNTSMGWDSVFSDRVFQYVYTDTINYNTEFNWILETFNVIEYLDTSRIFYVPHIMICWRTCKNHPEGVTQIELEIAEGSNQISDTIYGFGYLGDFVEYVEVEGVDIANGIVTLKNPLQNTHPPGHLLFNLRFDVGGFCISEFNLSIVRDHYHKPAVIHNICHEFMHQYNNGILEDIYAVSDTANLMYYMFIYQGNLTGNKLRYKSRSGVMQWDDVHDGPDNTSYF